ARRPKAVAAYLSRPEFALPPDRQTEIANEVERLLQTEEFSALFSAESLAEAPLTGRIGDATVFRQIDRLCLQGDEVWIVDYKTNRPPPDREKDVPAAYRKQLEEYRILLKGIYPDKKVRSFLLWTYAPKLMEISG
ncbi:MAG: PD-(D/E)XK nuclease family protein, partial [Alphaproteobacteria bacterium]|nr:PD-(D/E)XK nuclease family protein [Alphaproteobacteria bacterium]